MGVTESLVLMTKGLRVSGVVDVPALEEKETESCCSELPFNLRSGSFFTFIPRIQPATPPCGVSKVILEANTTFDDLIKMLFGSFADMSAASVKKMLHDHRYVITVSQMEAVVRVGQQSDCREYLGFVSGIENDIVLLVIRSNGNAPGSPETKSVFTHRIHGSQQLSEGTCFLISNYDPVKCCPEEK